MSGFNVFQITFKQYPWLPGCMFNNDLPVLSNRKILGTEAYNRAQVIRMAGRRSMLKLSDERANRIALNSCLRVQTPYAVGARVAS